MLWQANENEPLSRLPVKQQQRNPGRAAQPCSQELLRLIRAGGQGGENPGVLPGAGTQSTARAVQHALDAGEGSAAAGKTE